MYVTARPPDMRRGFASPTLASPTLIALAARAVVGRAAAVDHAFYFGPTIHARFTLALIDAPETFGRAEVNAIAIGDIDSQRRTGVDRFLQHLADRVKEFSRPRLRQFVCGLHRIHAGEEQRFDRVDVSEAE